MDTESVKTAVELSLNQVNFASQTVQLLISLATGALGISITFSKDIFTDAPMSFMRYLVRAWLFFVISIICGFVAMMALTGEQTQVDEIIYQILQNQYSLKEIREYLPSIQRPHITIPAMLQVVFFTLGIAGIFVYGVKVLKYRKETNQIKIFRL